MSVTSTASEIRAQPQQWRRILAMVPAHAGRLSSFFDSPVALVGAGSSYYVGLAAAAYMEERGVTRARAVPASVYRPGPGEAAVFISRSGTTTEVLEAAEAARGAGLHTAAITCDPLSPLVDLCGRAVVFDFIHEQSVVQTGSATGAFLFLRALVDTLTGGGLPDGLIGELERALQAPLQLERPIRHLVVLGSGWRFGIACEAALKAQEMALLWTERYVPLEYRHGPISCADENTLVFILDPPDDRILSLARDIEATGAWVVVAEHDPLVELVRLQQLALGLSLQRGLNPDRPRHLVRSVVL